MGGGGSWERKEHGRLHQPAGAVSERDFPKPVTLHHHTDLGLTRGDDYVPLKQEHFPRASLFGDTGTCGRVSSVSQQSTMASHTLLYL